MRPDRKITITPEERAESVAHTATEKALRQGGGHDQVSYWGIFEVIYPDALREFQLEGIPSC